MSYLQITKSIVVDYINTYIFVKSILSGKAHILFAYFIFLLSFSLFVPGKQEKQQQHLNYFPNLNCARDKLGESIRTCTEFVTKH